MERKFGGEGNERVLHRPLPTLSDNSHLVLDGDRFGSTAGSAVVEVTPRLPLLPLEKGTPLASVFAPKNRTE